MGWKEFHSLTKDAITEWDKTKKVTLFQKFLDINAIRH
jgi:hypothetical protein